MQQDSSQTSQTNPFGFLYNPNNNKPHNFIIPQYNQLQLNPFPNPIHPHTLQSLQYLPTQQIKQTYTTCYIKQFEYIAGSQNLFPILLEITNHCFIGFNRKQPSKYQKVKLPEMPTCFKIYNQYLYFGLKSGGIIVYNISNKTTLTMIQQFVYPIVQVQIINKDIFFAMDLVGNIKMFMERVVKVSVSVNVIIQQFRIKKRDKIKNFVKNLPFRKDKQVKQKIEQNETKQTGQRNPSQQKSQQKLKKQQSQQQFPKFCLLPAHLNIQSNTYCLVYYYKNQIKSIVLDKKYNKLSENIILDGIDSHVGMLELGQGAFTQSNQSHIILTLSLDNKIYYYRQITVQKIPQYIKITQKQHNKKIYNGKFLSNNLLLYLTQSGIQMSNINNNIQLVSKINYDKFSYIDFFNQEQSFNFDKRLLYGNIMKIIKQDNGDCTWCVLQGKRIQTGKLYTWRNYINLMADQYQWQKCLKSALMIYKDKITLLAQIPQCIQSRHQKMKQIFQKITLTYLSYQFKNSNNKLEYIQILRYAINFMIHTQSFVYLFTTIYQAIISYGLEQEFIMELEQYVESGCIKWMSQKVLVRVVEYYRNNKKSINTKNKKIPTQQILQSMFQQNLQQKTQQLHFQSHIKSQKQIQFHNQLSHNNQHLQTMIMNFDLTHMQKSMLLTICLNNQLYRSLIHICKQQCDYVTPIIKLCGLALSKTDQLPKISPQSHKIQHIHQTNTKLTQIIFYYIQQCLLGHYTQHNNIKSYIEMLRQLISFIFIPSSLVMLLELSIQYSFCIFNKMFGVSIMQYLLENQGEVIIRSNKYINNSNNSNGDDRDQLEIWQQINVFKYHYYHYNNNKYAQMHKQKQLRYLPIFQSSPSSQLTIYNNILCILIYTILDNYKKYHPNIQNNIIQKLLVEQKITQKQSYNDNNDHSNKQPIIKTKSDKQKSQIFLNQCHKFITYLILSNSFPIRMGWKILAYQFLLTYPQSFIHLDKQTNQLDINAMLMRIIDSILRQVNRIIANTDLDKSQQQREYIVLNVLLQYVDQCCKDDKQRQRVLPAKCYILSMLDRTDQIMKALLKSSKQATRIHIFQYLFYKLDANYNHASNQISAINRANQQFINTLPTFSLKLQSPLVTTILKNLKKLLSLSQPNTLKLLSKICQQLITTNSIQIQDILPIVDSLVDFPQIQLQFLQKIIKTYQEILHLQASRYVYTNLGLIGKNMQKLALCHLKVVMNHKKQQLQHYIIKINYPLQQAYNVCQQCNNKTAMAYVLIKSGRNLQGVLLICQLFVNNSKELFRDLAKNIENQNTLLQIRKMDEQLNKILETCSNQYINDVARGEQMWEKIGQKLFKQLNIKVVDSIPILKIRQILQRYINKIIKTMFSQVNSQFFIQKFSQNTKMTGIPTRIYLQAHYLVYERLGFKWEINSITKQLLRVNQMKNYKNIVKARSMGIPLDIEEHKCDQCQNVLIHKSKRQDKQIGLVNNKKNQQKLEQIIMYNCGHIYHLNCYKNIRQQLTKENSKSNQAHKSLKSPKKHKNSTHVCPRCQSDWNSIFYGEITGEAEKYSLGFRQRQSSILVQRKNKLAQYDCLDKIQRDGLDYLFTK